MTQRKTQPSGFKPSLGLAEEIADHVQKQIVSGLLVPGSRISEASITNDLGVSRGPVRESMRILVRRHLVELLPRKGARVTAFGPEDVTNLYDMQKNLLDLLIQSVFGKWREEHLEEFVQLQKQIDDAVADGSALDVIRLSFKFQWSACQIVGNGYLTSALVDLQPSFSRAYYRVMAAGREEMKSLSVFIREVIKLIVDNNTAACTKLVEEYSAHQRSIALQTFSK